MKLNKEKFLKSELGGNLQECVTAWDHWLTELRKFNIDTVGQKYRETRKAGAYGSLAYDLKGHEEPLQVIIHFADFWSAQFLEVGKLDRFNDQVKSEETTDEVKEEGENNEEE